MFARVPPAQKVLPLSCYSQVGGLLSLSLSENEDTIKLTTIRDHISWHLAEYELGQYEFIVSHVLCFFKKCRLQREPMCKLGYKIQTSAISRFKKEILINRAWFQ